MVWHSERHHVQRRAGQSEPRPSIWKKRRSTRRRRISFRRRTGRATTRSAARPCSDDLAAIAINTAFLASGHCDLVVECSLKSFDFMALVPVIEGAGGVICDWEGLPLTRHSDGRVIAAANAALLQQALAILQQ